MLSTTCPWICFSAAAAAFTPGSSLSSSCSAWGSARRNPAEAGAVPGPQPWPWPPTVTADEGDLWPFLGSSFGTGGWTRWRHPEFSEKFSLTCFALRTSPHQDLPRLSCPRRNETKTRPNRRHSHGPLMSLIPTPHPSVAPTGTGSSIEP